MKFFSSKIVTKPISLEDAIKNAGNKPKYRSLDEIIASVKQVKTASAQAKTAAEPEVEPQKVEIKVAGELQKEALTRVDPSEFPGEKDDIFSLSPDEAFRDRKHQELTGKHPGMKEVGKNKYKFDNTPSYRKEKKEHLNKPTTVPPLSVGRDAPVSKPKSIGPAPVSASGKKQLKMASKVNFTQWEDPKMVVDAWKQHGSVEACVKNISGNTNDPQTYCSLLQVAASEADKMVKAASAKRQTKAASKKEAPVAPVYKKIAKLTANERSFLDEYFTKIYGKEYVDALLGDY